MSFDTIDPIFMEEMRQDMLEEDRRYELIERRIRNDVDFFLEQINFAEFQEMASDIRKLCNDYGYDFADLQDQL